LTGRRGCDNLVFWVWISFHSPKNPISQLWVEIMERKFPGRFTMLFKLFSFALFTALLFVFPFVAVGAQLTVAWDPNTEADLKGYRVYYGTASRSYGPPFDVGKATSYTLTNLAPGQKFFIAVTAYDTSDKESAFSNEVSATTPALEGIRAPNVLTGPTSGRTAVALSYTAGGSSSSLGHSIQYQFDWKGDGTVLSPWGSAVQSRTWTAGGTYRVRARARCAIHTNLVSGWSDSLSVSIGVPRYLSAAGSPIINSFAIENGSPTTHTRRVILHNVATNKPRYYMASESSEFSGARWRFYSRRPKFPLSAGAGKKTIYFKVKNRFGESPVVSGTITVREEGILVPNN